MAKVIPLHIKKSLHRLSSLKSFNSIVLSLESIFLLAFMYPPHLFTAFRIFHPYDIK